METVSAAWSAAQKKRVITDPALLEISIVVTDPEAQAAASSSATNEEIFSDAETLVERDVNSPVRYATLEHNIWALDGNFQTLPSSPPYGENGYVGFVLSGDDGVFEAPPSITITFGKVFTTFLEGITIAWGTAYDNEYADSFAITAYNGSQVVSQKTVTGNREQTSVVFGEISNYDSIVITISKWSLPHRRARIESIIVGVEHRYQRSDVISYKHTRSVDMLSAELPNLEVGFEVNNMDYLFDPDNENGMSKYLMSRQEVTIYYGYRLNGMAEKIPAAVTFLDEWDTPRNGRFANFTARGLLIFMDELYTGPMTGNLYAIAEAAIIQASLPPLSNGGQRWELDQSMSSIDVPSGLDLSSYRISEVLQLAANAACCCMWEDRRGVLHIAPRTAADTSEHAIPKDMGYGYPETTLRKPLKSVSINDNAYVLTVGPQGVVQPVNNPLISAERAPTVAAWVRDMLLNRQTLSGGWRADPSTDVLDTVDVDTPFHTNRTVLTSVELTFNGAWRGEYEGTVM